MKEYLFLFTISPVQSFIAQARKTHDLFAGSQILSDLTAFAMKAAGGTTEEEKKKVQFIFPTINQPSKPNRFVAIIETEEIQSFGNQVEATVKKHFVEALGKKVIELLPSSKAQLEDFLKIYWVAREYVEGTSYPEQIKRLEQDLGAAKNIRYFQQFPERGRKCSMSGEYNVKFYRKTEGETRNNRIVSGEENKLFHDDVLVIDAKKNSGKIKVSHLQPGEGLCAVSMMKRFYKSDNEFPSTANIALSDTLSKIEKNKRAKELADEFACCFGKDGWRTLKNGQLFYEENLTSEYFDKQGLNHVSLKCATDKLATLIPFVKEKNLQFSKYYAILAFDADGMGKKLQACKGAGEHTRVSELLAGFAELATDYIDNEQTGIGRTVYAGGDDFLGLINLNHLFKVMKYLRDLFDEKVNANLRAELIMTFSAGVAIGHYKTPLSEVLGWAKQMERVAKSVEKEDQSAKKDAFSIAVLKRSGEIHYTIWRWKTFENNWTTDIFQRLIVHLKDGELSKKFITNLSSEYEKRLDTDGNWGKQAQENGFEEELNAMLAYELDYFIKRSAASDEEAKSAVKGLADHLFSNYQHHIGFKLSVQNLLNMLHICEFITTEINPVASEQKPTSQPQNSIV
ncbi:MAG: type III-B CRISPR-associated protein Cas10/Cmr2 [Bacteroidota bacterium]